MKMWIGAMGLVGLSLAGFACVAGTGESEPQQEGPLGSASQAQIDPLRAYTITQGLLGTTASAWAGTVGGSAVEYWVTRSNYQPSSGRTFNGASKTCAAWKKDVCGRGWTGSTYYRAVYTQTTLDCGLPPGPCTPSAGAVSLLGNGSYRTLGGGAPFAWTYVSGSCEYWSMHHTISTGTSIQNTQSPGWTSLGNFQTAMCSGGNPPPLWYEAYYEPVADFCSSDPC